jgi:hypothetical protein
MRNVREVLVEKSEGRRPAERNRRRMDLKTVEYENSEWIRLA